MTILRYSAQFPGGKFARIDIRCFTTFRAATTVLAKSYLAEAIWGLSCFEAAQVVAKAIKRGFPSASPGSDQVAATVDGTAVSLPR